MHEIKKFSSLSKESTDFLYQDDVPGPDPFYFDNRVSEVFDDMAKRSIPTYLQGNQLVSELIGNQLKKGMRGTVCDLGVSTGATIAQLIAHLLSNKLPLPPFYGLDNSPAMLSKARQQLQIFATKNNLSARDFLIQLEEKDLKSFGEKNSLAVICHYTLHFTDPIDRPAILKQIFESLVPNGIFFLAEKTRFSDPSLEKEMDRIYYQFKRFNGYHPDQIALKRKALYDVLRPLSLDENLRLLKEAGFSRIEVIHRWCHFVCLIAQK